MLVSMKSMLNRAYREHYAVGQFNINNLEWIKSILTVAERLRSPAILGVSGGTVTHMCGLKTIADTVKGVHDYLKITVPISLHLDHGKTEAICQEAVDVGFNSIMFDGSHLAFEENMAISRRLVDYIKQSGKEVSLETELGTIAGSEDGVANSRVIYADFNQCVEMSKIGIDCLAAALGSTHGLYKGKAKLGFKEMEAISDATQIPLVLHGGTGISDEDMQKAMTFGTAKINVNTEFMYAWCESIKRLFLNQDSEHDINDPRKVITYGLKEVEKRIERRIRLFKSNDLY